MTPKSACLALAAALACMGTAQTATAFDLRNLSVVVDWKTDPDDEGSLFHDAFNNNDPQTVAAGQGYLKGLSTPNPLYSVAGSVTGAETTPGDFTVEGIAIGQLRVSQANALTTPIVFNAQPFVNEVNRIRLNNPPGAPSILNSSRSNFVANAAWDFVTPVDVNFRYGMRLSDDFGGTFNDLVALDIVRMADGTAGAQMRRISGDGTDNFTATEFETRSLASGLDAGHSIADVNLVAMHMYWFGDTQRVVGELELLQVSDGGATVVELGVINFSNRYEIFRGESTSRLQAGASWATPIPEPSTCALLLAGLAGIGALAKRHRAG